MRGFASDLAALLAALGGLASAEASLSLRAFLRMLELRAIGLVLAGLAIVLLALAATTLLAQALSTAAAMILVAFVSCLAAALALWRAAVWRERIGFAHTREALATESVPPEGPRS